MKKYTSQLICSAAMLAMATALSANEQPTGNYNPAYDPSKVQAQLRVDIDKNTEVVHFVRDTNDPKIVTKAYVLKHADPYSIRPYVREMVQAQRVDYNNTAGESNTAYYNVYRKSGVAVPTGVECIVYADGVGMLIISAEEYRFADSEHNIGIDSLVAKLDQPGIVNSSGQPKFIYFPKNRSASELQTMVKAVGMNVSGDTSELISGKDKVTYDESLNCLFFNTALYSRSVIEDMLKLYDVVHPQVKITYTVYEISAENDGKMGADFQAWKNNDGVNFFSTGAMYRDNWTNIFGAMAEATTNNSNYFSFNPKWNSRYLDFLVSKSKGEVVYTGTITVQNNSEGVIDKKNGVFYVETTTTDTKEGPQVNTASSAAFQFKMSAKPSITPEATTLDVSVSTQSLIGYLSDGSPRISNYSTATKVMVGNKKSRFYIGSIDKSERVKVNGGVPILKDLPILGWVFSTESESTKKSQLVVVADCEIVTPAQALPSDIASSIKNIRTENRGAGETNTFGYGQWLLDPNKKADFDTY